MSLITHLSDTLLVIMLYIKGRVSLEYTVMEKNNNNIYVEPIRETEELASENPGKFLKQF